jgi:hypothetical protein
MIYLIEISVFSFRFKTMVRVVYHAIVLKRKENTDISIK